MFNQGAPGAPGANISSGRTDSLTYSGDSGSNSAANTGDDVLNNAFIGVDDGTIVGVPVEYLANILGQLVNVTNGVLYQDLSPIGSFGSGITSMASILLASNGSNPTDNEFSSTFGGGKKNNPAYNELIADIKKVTKALSNIKLVIKSKRNQSLNHSWKRTCKRKINRQPSHVSPKNLRKSKRKRKINRKIKM
jgi:hypothetical protein